MKSLKKILIVAVAVALAAMVFAGCGASKTAVSPDTFYSTMTAAGYHVVDDTSSADGSAESVLLALAPDGSYQIEYVKVPAAATAKGIYDYNVLMFNEQGGGAAGQAANGSNYDVYGLNTGDRTMYICQVDDTCVFVDTDAVAHAAEIESVISSLGYGY